MNDRHEQSKANVQFSDSDFMLLKNQRESLIELVTAYKEGRNMILADERGFGKTITLVSFLQRIF